jgi:hypothetical protein
MKKQKKLDPFSLRLTPNADYLLDRLEDKLGLTRPGTIELAIRELAAKYSLEVDDVQKIRN